MPMGNTYAPAICRPEKPTKFGPARHPVMVSRVGAVPRRGHHSKIGRGHRKNASMTTAKALHRFIGSIAFIGAARAGFAVLEDPDEKGRRVFLHAKNILAAPPQGLAFRLEERVAVVANGAADPIYATGIVWDVEPVVWTADEVLAGSAAAATGQR